MAVLKQHPTASIKSLIYPSLKPSELLKNPALELVFNARAALMIAFAEIASGQSGCVLLPAFHCPCAITPVLLAGLRPIYYRIKRDMTIDYDDVISRVDGSVLAILVIHFFGVQPDLKPLSMLREKRIAMVEDCSHSFLSNNPLTFSGNVDSDYRIFSFWKLLPCGIGGGILRSKNDNDPKRMVLKNSPLRYRLKNYKNLCEEAMEVAEYHGLSRLASMANWVSRKMRKSTLHAWIEPAADKPGEDYYPVEPHSACWNMPRHCVRIVERSDLHALIKKRRENYLNFEKNRELIQPMQPVFECLSDQTCPWVYPVFLINRDQIDFQLKAAGVQLHTFGLHLHSSLFKSKGSLAISDALYLSKNVLCLAIHQDLSELDIDKEIQIIQNIFKSRNFNESESRDRSR